MTLQDTQGIAAMVRLLWPHSVMAPKTPEVWHPFLERLNRDEVEAAVRELAAGGREHAPPIGVIVQAAADRATDVPTWDEAWAEIDHAIRRRGSYRPPEPNDFSHPVIGAFAIPVWTELCGGPAPGTRDFGIHYAQQRDAYNALRNRAQRDVGLVAVGAPRRRRLPSSLSDALSEIAAPAPQITEVSE